ncbi:MAG: hypothetical protein HYV42_02070 [Candidatus Magasanikbacteria bacterium]|nr:hypothetical protein [Candidatus Magasanikbacteria bacterium]
MEIRSLISLLPLVSGVIALALGFFVWLKKPKDLLQILFFLYTVGIAIWLFGTFFLFNATTEMAQIRWDRFIYAGVVFIPVFLYHFGLLYSQLVDRQRRWLYLGYVLALVFLSASQLSSQFISGIYTYQWGVHSLAGPLHHIFLVYFFFYFVFFFVNLIRHYRQATGLHKVQVRYVLIGYAILDIIGPLAFLPAYGIAIHPIVFLSAIPFAGLLAYAIIRYQALNLKVIAAEVIIALLNLVVVGQSFFPPNTIRPIFKLVVILGVLGLSVSALYFMKTEMRLREKAARIVLMQEANAKLELLDRQKTEFLNIAAHQLRTPVSIIKSYTAMLRDGDFGELPAEISEVLRHMEDSAQWLVRLGDELVNIAHLEQGATKYHWSSVELGALAEAVVKELVHKANRAGLTIRWQRPGEAYTVVGDAEKLQHAMFNLIDNAIKYTPEGKSITVEIIAKNDGQFVFVVRDEGVGFAPEDRPRFFEKFSRGNNASNLHVNRSSGLGLYIVRKFIEGHGGEVFAESAGIGHGSRFGWRIPQKFATVQV